MNTKLIASLVLAVGMVGRASAQTTVSTALASNLYEPVGIVCMSDETLYISDSANDRIVKFLPSTGEFKNLAGLKGYPGSVEGTNSKARFHSPEGVVYDPFRGGLVVADSANQLIRFVGLNGIVTNIAGAAEQVGLVDGFTAAARFRYPLGLAIDDVGNIYIADAKNDAIRLLRQDGWVTNLALTNLLQPAAVAVGEAGDIWVADTGHNVIKRIDSFGAVTIVAGNPNFTAGYRDSLLASDSLLNSPRGLLWLGADGGLLISDSGNNTVRRLFYNPELDDYSVETLAGIPTSGFVDGAALTAQFNAPVGLVSDVANGGFLVADMANHAIRRISTGPPLPAVTTPVIGWVEFVQPTPLSDFVSRLNAISGVAMFNNDVIIAILGENETQTYYTFGPTPVNQYQDTIPSPGPGTGTVAPFYKDGLLMPEVPRSIISPTPDVTIKAVGTQTGRRPSPVVQVRMQFKVATPQIDGDNGALFVVTNSTRDCVMWYTTDSTDPVLGPPSLGPVLAGDTVSLFVDKTNVMFKIRGFRTNYGPSEIVSKLFKTNAFFANTISLGFEAGEASSKFIAAAGQRFYAPITLTVIPNTRIYGLQFNVVSTNLTGPNLVGSEVGFESMLVKPIGNDDYLVIPPAMAIANGSGIYTNLLFTNASANFLGIGWIERKGHTNLYNAQKDDLITYSMAHDRVYLSSAGQVIVGGYSFRIPDGSADGDSYRIKVGLPSASAGGLSPDVYVAAPTNGALSAQRDVTVGSMKYLVGDVAPFRWFNAGDFGDSNIINNDLMQIFQSAVYKINNPPEGSSMEDAMDSCCFDAARAPVSPDLLFNGSDVATINGVVFGDGELNIADVFVTLRRSLDPSLKWIQRYWSGNQLQYEAIDSPLMGRSSVSKQLVPKVSTSPLATRPVATFSVDDVIAVGNGQVQVPIRVCNGSPFPVRVLMFNLMVQPLDGSPAITQPVQFSAVSALGAPGLVSSRGPANYAAAWLDNTVLGVAGTNLIGMLTITLPQGVSSDGAYRIHFEHLSASPNGVGVFLSQTFDGLVTMRDRSASSWNDGISDEWRLKFFGSISNLRSAAAADPDGDGQSNLAEFKAGTCPVDLASRLKLVTSPRGLDGVRLQWPAGVNRRYVLESCADFGGSWRPIATNIYGFPGMGEYLDPSAGNGSRFYRLRVQE